MPPRARQNDDDGVAQSTEALRRSHRLRNAPRRADDQLSFAVALQGPTVANPVQLTMDPPGPQSDSEGQENEVDAPAVPNFSGGAEFIDPEDPAAPFLRVLVGQGQPIHRPNLGASSVFNPGWY